MANYAVIRIKGHQYKVLEGQEIFVDRIREEKVEPEVLLLVKGDKVLVGKPVLGEAKIETEILKEEEKGDKIHIRKYKAKSRYRRHLGFRPLYTKLLVKKIS